MTPKVNGKLVVFDLDGTLIDSRLDLAASANRMLESYGAGALPVDAIAAMVGDGAKVLVERALAAAGLDPHLPDALARFLAIYDEELLTTTLPYPGVVPALEAAARLAPLALLTNKPERPTRLLLDAFGMAPHFGWTIGGDSGFGRKPDPAGLRWLMDAAEAGPRATLFVGDSPVDVETARRAGVRLCLARYGFGALRGPVQLDPDDREVSESTSLSAVLGRFLGGE